MEIEVTCNNCEQKNKTDVKFAEWAKYANGALVQDVWPNKSPQEREIIIGYAKEYYLCDECWSEIFDEEESQ